VPLDKRATTPRPAEGSQHKQQRHSSTTLPTKTARRGRQRMKRSYTKDRDVIRNLELLQMMGLLKRLHLFHSVQ